MKDANFLRYGRHLRLPSGTRVVVGRDEHENAIIENLARKGDKLLIPKDIPGPSVLCRGMVTQDDVSLAGGIAASYKKGGTVMNLKIKNISEEEKECIIRNVKPLDKHLISTWRIGLAHA